MASALAAAAPWPVAHGSFIQEYLCKDWSDEKWQSEFRYLGEAGMSVLIFGSAANSQKHIAYYPTRLDGYKCAEGYGDLVDACLRNAARANFQVFIGLNFHEDWWRKSANDPQWLFAQMEEGNRIADELYARYKQRYPREFAGWYWVWEADNLNFKQPKQRATLAKALDISVTHLHALDTTMPVMLCPFMNRMCGGADEYGDFWKDIFANCSLGRGDIFCPQDCVGGGGLRLEDVPAWFGAMGKAVATKPGLRFWCDTETFAQSDWTAGTIDRFVKQIEIVAPFVEKSVTFAYCHYYSPNNVDAGFHRTYLKYVRTGHLDKTPPDAPANPRIERLDKSRTRLDWQASTDNIGVCGYDIYRNGERITRHQTPRLPEAAGFTPASYTDTDATPTLLRYRIEAYDFAGNHSPAVEITAP
ncbi:MAG: DUF4434 domain-containing protein [bacterium]|nr:DUF4434 domain-containing protein [Candidatus Sumerlaeota bacterium]